MKKLIIENRAGAGGSLGMQSVLSSPPDGYTIGFAAPNYSINATLYEKLPYNFIRDAAPVAGTMRLTNVMVVHPSVPAKNVAEFIAHAKANPGKVNYASAGNGTTIHLNAELFKLMTGTNLVHVPYRGGAPALVDMVAGQVQVMFDNLPTSMEHIRSGKLRALAGIAEQVEQNLLEPHGVRVERAHVLLGFDDEAVLVLLGELSGGADDLVDKPGHINRFGMEVELARFDLGEVQYLIDEAKEVGPGGIHAAQRFLRFFRAEARRVGDHHLGQADDGVEGGAQLVAHAGEELRLVLTRLRELPTLLLDLAEQTRILDRQHRLGCERLKKLNRIFRKIARLLAPDHERPNDAVCADQRHDETCSKSGSHCDLSDWAWRLVADIRDL
jgi:hypothetical protein